METIKEEKLFDTVMEIISNYNLGVITKRECLWQVANTTLELVEFRPVINFKK